MCGIIIVNVWNSTHYQCVELSMCGIIIVWNYCMELSMFIRFGMRNQTTELEGYNINRMKKYWDVGYILTKWHGIYE